MKKPKENLFTPNRERIESLMTGKVIISPYEHSRRRLKEDYKELLK